ncbi:MAG: amino acid ABC transporter permease [Oscillospiraceae bacterium]|nr:amino acid ABC transporter permease [Oscillospiraceae bacterium]
MNCVLFALTLIMSVPLGLIITLGTMAKFKPVKWVMKTFVWIIRGTPLMLQLFVALYAPGLIFNYLVSSNPAVALNLKPIFMAISSNRMIPALIALVINYAAYFSEIFRGGIESIPVGQYEAGQVLGLTKVQVFFKVVLFQVIKRITPPMGNEIITLVKDTALARVIGVVEILQNASRFAAKGIIWPLFASGLYFLAFTAVLSALLSFVEKKLDYYKG